jgi:hypothetical protein
MSKKQNVAARFSGPEVVDPTLQFTYLELLGVTYKLCFRFRELAIANARLRAQGVNADLLSALPRLDIDNVAPVLAAGLGTFHPELKYSEIELLVDYDTVFLIRDKIAEAWLASLPPRMKGSKENPIEPVE